MHNKKRVVLGLFIIGIMIISIIYVSAWSPGDLFRVGKGGGGGVGKLFNRLFNVSVTMVNTPPEIIFIWEPLDGGSYYIPNEDNLPAKKEVNFTVTLYDINGVNDIKESYGAFVLANFTNLNNGISSSENLRAGSICNDIGQYGALTANWTCAIRMEYWDIPFKQWTITAQAIDSAGGSATASSGGANYAYFTFGDLLSWKIDRPDLSWSVAITSKNVSAVENPLNITNTGNVNITGQEADNKFITVEAQNLTGVTDLYEMDSYTFSADDVLANCNPATGYERLSAGNETNITDVSFERRPSSDTKSNASIYFCLKEVLPIGIPSDAYVANSSYDGPWYLGAIY